MYQDMLNKASSKEEAEIIELTLQTMKNQLSELSNKNFLEPIQDEKPKPSSFSL